MCILAVLTEELQIKTPVAVLYINMNRNQMLILLLLCYYYDNCPLFIVIHQKVLLPQ